MHLLPNHWFDARNRVLPLRRGREFHSSDLRFMAIRTGRFTRSIDVFESGQAEVPRSGEIWVRIGQVRSWDDAAALVEAARAATGGAGPVQSDRSPAGEQDVRGRPRPPANSPTDV